MTNNNSPQSSPVKLVTKGVSQCYWDCNAEFVYENNFENKIAAVKVASLVEGENISLVRFYVDGPHDPSRTDVKWKDRTYQLQYMELFVGAMHTFEDNPNHNPNTVELCMCHKHTDPDTSDWLIVSIMVEPSYLYNLSQDFFKRLLGPIATHLHELPESASDGELFSSKKAGVAVDLNPSRNMLYTGTAGESMCSTPSIDLPSGVSTNVGQVRCLQVNVEDGGASQWSPYQAIPFDKGFLVYNGSCPYKELMGMSYGPKSQQPNETVTWLIMTTSVTMHYDEYTILKRMYGNSRMNTVNWYDWNSLRSSIPPTDIRYSDGDSTLANASNMARDGKYIVKCEQAGQRRMGGRPSFTKAISSATTPASMEAAPRGPLVFDHGSGSALPVIMLSVFCTAVLIVAFSLPALQIKQWRNVLAIFAGACLQALLIVSTTASPMTIVMVLIMPLILFGMLMINFAGKFAQKQQIKGYKYICIITTIAVACLLGVYSTTCIVGIPLQFHYNSGTRVQYYYIMKGYTNIKHEFEKLHFIDLGMMVSDESQKDLRFFIGTKGLVDVMFIAPLYYRGLANHVDANAVTIADDGTSFTTVNGPYEVIPSNLDLTPKVMYKVCVEYDKQMHAQYRSPLDAFATALQMNNDSVNSIGDAKQLLRDKQVKLFQYLKYNNEASLD